MEEFTQTFEVRWADLDPNFHVRHSVYPDYCATARIEFLTRNGFSLKKFAQLQLGPILFKETTQFFKELVSGDQVKITIGMANMTESGHKWAIHHDLFRMSDGEKVASVTVEGAWMSTKLRKVVPPPEDLLEVLKSMVR